MPPAPGVPGVVRRLLRPVVDLRNGESTTAILMFAYSFLAMTAYNVVRPITRSKFISDLGADNLPWALLAAGLLIGVIMHVYAQVITRVPRRWAIPVTQLACVVVLVGFWALFSAGYEAASVGFYVFGLIFGLLLISQFWTLANDIYDARHAKRLFGFIGGGASLGGATGAAITATVVAQVGTVNLLLVGAAVLLLCVGLVIVILRREAGAGTSIAEVEARGTGGAEAIRLLRESRHLQIIAVIIGCAAMGGVIIEQQLNMAAESTIGQNADGITRFLAQVTFYLSIIGFLIQVTLTSRIHTLLGIGFALLILPVSLGATAVVMLFNASLWAPAVARVADTSLRYTVDKTTREILFLPLPAAIKYRAKAFVDVTMDRLAKAMGALALLVLIKPWGLGLTWQQLSFASLTLMAIWIVLAQRARREYMQAFRRSLADHDVAVADLRPPHADLQTVELLVEELAHPDEQRVLYAIDLLESLGKPRLVTPLLLHHGSPRVRARVLESLEAQPAETAARWLPAVERLLADEDAGVRARAVGAISVIRGANANTLLGQHLGDADPRIVATAAVALVDRADAATRQAAEAALERLAGDTGAHGRVGRLEVARALGDLTGGVGPSLVASLVLDGDVDVAREAIRSAGRLGPGWPILIPPLVSRLRHRLLKNEARDVLVGYGEDVIGLLAHFLRDPAEDPWVRRHLPATLARLPGQRTLDLLTGTLGDRDGFLRYKAIMAIESVTASRPDLVVNREPLEALALSESLRHFNALTLHANLTSGDKFGADTLLVRALEEKQHRSRERVFRLLGVLYPQGDLAAARRAIERGDAAQRASATEYLDNVLSGPLRKRVLLMIDEMPHAERVERTNALFGTRPRTPEDTLAQLIHDDDQVIAASAIHLSAERGLSSLADDVEFALAHRDASDWYVFEAASWALASWRVTPDVRRARWIEALPTVELVSRLRHLKLFEYVSVDELFRFASTARQVRHEPNRALYEAGLVPDTLQLLIDGDAHLNGGEQVLAPSPLAFEELVVGRPVRRAIHAGDVAITLSLTEDEFLTLVFDNVEVAQGLFRMAIGTHGMHASCVTRGMVPLDAGRERVRPGLGPMERALLMSASPLAAGATGGQLLRLGMIAVEVPLTPGEILASASDDPAIFVVVSGAIRVDRTGQAPEVAGPGDAVGFYETLANVAPAVTLVAADPGFALRISGQELFDLLAADVALLQRLFGYVLSTDR